MYLYVVSFVVILSNWVCDNWVYRFPEDAMQHFSVKRKGFSVKRGEAIQ